MGAVILRGEPPDWAASGDGYGYGYGDGYGYGYGDGSGYGYGDGSGYGDGYGSWGGGDGSGYGAGDGGDGSGDGSGYGPGDGAGDGAYWLACLKYFSSKWTEAQRIRLTQLQQLGAKIAFWRSDESGKACNGGSSKELARPGLVEKIPGPLKICTHNALHATELPIKWQGERVWCVALIGELQQHEDKFGALEREIIGECE